MEISEDTARAALKALERQHGIEPTRVEVIVCEGGIELHCGHDGSCGAGYMSECSCEISRAWRELANFLGER